jgi:hypothetical protein
MILHYDEIEEVLEQITFRDYTFHLNNDHERYSLQATYREPDVNTGVLATQWTRIWDLNDLTKDQVVQTIFKCCLTSMEHRTREHFLYKNRPIFGPHFDVEQLWAISKDRE